MTPTTDAPGYDEPCDRCGAQEGDECAPTCPLMLADAPSWNLLPQ